MKSDLNIDEVLNKKGILLLKENPINSDSITMVLHSRSSFEELEFFLKKNFVNDFIFRITVLNGYERLNCPSVIVDSSNYNTPVCINLGFDVLNEFTFKFSFFFYPSTFKRKFNIFTFFHELGHTSKYQRKVGKCLSSIHEREAHSDFFGLYFVLSKFKTVTEKLSFLEGYFKMRKNKYISPKNVYSSFYYDKIASFFLINMENIDFNLDYKIIDTFSFEYISAIKNNTTKDISFVFLKNEILIG